ncbi:NAD(P)/FAD-dependent oxidoreductase [Marasmitruncus massiliensis]|uniref:NAD(P)/FAD-dependent oxidoreductase n=1 Tax=Marasmitruncus massiliensis TaxID=1944642 RepID=UPI00241DE323|nr:FAD-dependent oxidoreductase [Marasmitruncus massiliensis]
MGEFALYSLSRGILDSFNYTIALAENTVQNGANYFFDCEVTGIRWEQGRYRLFTKQGNFTAKWVVNSAGLGCRRIAEMLGIHGYTIKGSKGTHIILDKRTGPLLPMPVYSVPSNTYMGIHVTPTVDRTVTVGPDAEYMEDFWDYGVHQKNMDYLAESASSLWPHIHRADYIRNYAGTLSKWVDDQGVIHDFVIETRSEAPQVINLMGIESPELTAALPIARYAINLLVSRNGRTKTMPLNRNVKASGDL